MPVKQAKAVKVPAKSAAPEAPCPSAENIFRTLNAYQASEALKTGIELDIFTAIAEGRATPAALAAHCKASERGMRILCDYLTVIRFLTKQGGAYALTPDSEAFLNRKSPVYLGSIVGFLGSNLIKENFQHLTAAVRKGGTAKDLLGTLAPEHPIWVEFARSMGPMMGLDAQPMAQLLGAGQGKPWKVLDIAAGHGIFGIAVAQANAQAEVTALDWPNVLAVAREHAAAAGVAKRWKALPGSAFEVDFGAGYDLVLLTNFLHHFDPYTNEKLLKKVRACLAPGGRAAALEFVPNEDRISPPAAATFSLVMLGSTPAGDAYTYAELDKMFRLAGFAKTELHAMHPSPQSVVVARQ